MSESGHVEGRRETVVLSRPRVGFGSVECHNRGQEVTSSIGGKLDHTWSAEDGIGSDVVEMWHKITVARRV